MTINRTHVRKVLAAFACNPEIQGTELALKLAKLVEAIDKTSDWKKLAYGLVFAAVTYDVLFSLTIMYVG